MKRMVEMTHHSDPDSVYTTVPEQSYREYWAEKGWVTKEPLEDQESEAEATTNNNTNTEDDPT